MRCCRCSAMPSSSTRATSRSISLIRATTQLRKTMFAWWRCARQVVRQVGSTHCPHHLPVQGVFKMLREDFAYQPTVKVRCQPIAGDNLSSCDRARELSSHP